MSSEDFYPAHDLSSTSHRTGMYSWHDYPLPERKA